jgi:hypothetical protein
MREHKEKRVHLDIRPTEEFVHRVDRWRAKQMPIPPRAVAIRRLVEQALDAAESELDENG